MRGALALIAGTARAHCRLRIRHQQLPVLPRRAFPGRARLRR
jgi:hypothetical protein